MSYFWTPAGSHPGYLADGHMWIRYGRTGVNNFEAKYDYDKKIAWIKFPDREFISCFRRYIGDKPGRDEVYKPMWWPKDSTCFDEYVPLSFFSPNSFMEDVTPYVLISAHNAFELKMTSRKFLSGGKYKVIGDSGGSQLKHGTSAWIDPVKVSKWQNDVVDIGCVLDAPPRPADQGDEKVIKALCRIQQQNNAIGWEIWNNVDMLNAVHGFTLKQCREWAKAVDDPRFHGWCIGQDSVQSFLAGLRPTIMAMKEFPKKHYHTFALGGAAVRIPLAAWIGKYVDSYTSDSTTHMAGVRWRLYFYQTPLGGLEKVRMGEGKREKSFSMYGKVISDTGPKKGPDDMRPLPCSCPVCSRVGYQKFFALPPIAGSATLLTVHNTWAMAKHAKSWSDLAAKLSLGDYIEAIKLSKDTEDISTSLKYVEHCMTNGMDEGDRKFKNMIGDEAVVAGRMKVLFSKRQTRCEDPNLKQAMLGSALSTTEDVIPAYLGEDEMTKLGIRRLTKGPAPKAGEKQKPKRPARHGQQKGHVPVGSSK